MTELLPTHRGVTLSVFSGIDLLGMGFEAEGFCVVSAGDLAFGRDVRKFRPPPGVFTGVIGGPPCQDFSAARRSAPILDGYGARVEWLWCNFAEPTELHDYRWDGKTFRERERIRRKRKRIVAKLLALPPVELAAALAEVSEARKKGPKP